VARGCWDGGEGQAPRSCSMTSRDVSSSSAQVWGQATYMTVTA
jgi:hypothetical protein